MQQIAGFRPGTAEGSTLETWRICVGWAVADRFL
jgi:hypothetical protein